MIICFYNKFNINVLAIILALLIVFVIFFGFNKFEINKKIFKENVSNTDIKDVEVNKSNKEENSLVDNKIDSEKNNFVMMKEINDDEIIYNKKWYLEINTINLIAEINEGTEENILEDYIGHFSSTPVNVGNVGLAAHNRGYKNNYFSRLKELKIGDKINYYIDGHKFEYEVSEILIIYETDWSMLENTKDNRITMITCVENREKYRLCVQAKRIKEE